MNLHEANLCHDPDRQVGEVFRRLSALNSLSEDAFEKAVRSMLVA